jgi:hypothetical protein
MGRDRAGMDMTEFNGFRGGGRYSVAMEEITAIKPDHTFGG